MRYFSILLHPIQLVQRKLMHDVPSGPNQLRQLAQQSLRVPPGPVNTMLGWLALTDPLLGRLGLPVGTSLIAIGRLKQ